MERNIDMREVSDGKLYDLEDMVRADCAGCAGCSACCKGMGSSIVLDPLDMHRLVSGTKTDAKRKHPEKNTEKTAKQADLP